MSNVAYSHHRFCYDKFDDGVMLLMSTEVFDSLSGLAVHVDL